MLRFFCVVTLAVLITLCARAQNTLRGYIEDGTTGERLLGANLYDQARSLGSSTNSFGFFSYSYAGDTLRLRVSYIGYRSLDTVFIGNQTNEVILSLRDNADLATVEVVASTQSERIDEQVQMSKLDVPIEQIKRAPAFLGENDILKTFQLLPGVQGGAEGTAGLYVRGGSPDQNLILLDGVPVYNPSHVLGIFSIFNADAVNNVSLTKGGFPARFGGRLSSVMEVNMRDGHKDKWHGQGGIGIISSRLTLDGPVGPKTRVLVSGRRTYLDLIQKPFVAMANRRSGDDTKVGLNFFDLNTKIRHDLNAKHRLYLSGYLGGDKFASSFRENFDDGFRESGGGIEWGNEILAARWNWELSPRVFSNTTFTYSRYGIEFDNQFERLQGDEYERTLAIYKSGIRDLGVKYDLDFIPNPNHYIRTGVGFVHHAYNPGVVQVGILDINEQSLDTLIGANKTYGSEAYAYVEDEWRLSPKLSLNVGLHAALFNRGKTYTSVQPRLAGRFKADHGVSYKASFASMAQFINLLTSETLSLPTDLWVPSTAKVAPQRSWQAAVGVAKVWRGKFEFSAEAFYKKMDNVLSYRAGASFLNFDPAKNWEDNVVQGTGEAYGLELLAQKKLGRTTGWIGYTLSWNDRQFSDLNGGQPFPFRYDRRHDIGILVSHKFNNHIDLSGSWIYGTGNAFTLTDRAFYTAFDPTQIGSEVSAPVRIEQPTERNAYRMSATHRLDLSLSLTKEKKWGERSWVFGVYNAYWRKNPFYAEINETRVTNDGVTTVDRQLVERSILPIIPSLSYQFKF